MSFLTLSFCFRDGNKSESEGNATESFLGQNVFGISELEKGSI